MMEKIRVWIRTRKPDGSYEGHYEEIRSSEFNGTIFTGSPESPQITLNCGRIFDIYAGNDGELGYTEEIDNSDPVLIKKISDENEARLRTYYERHPEEDPKNLPTHPNCRCWISSLLSD